MIANGLRAVMTLLVGTAVISTTASATAIGPDGFGYRATDEVTYNYFDITATGTQVFGVYADDSARGPLDIGFNFNFYGNTYSNFYVSSNGVISFSGSYTPYSNTNLTASGGPTMPVILPYWDDLVVDPITRGLDIWYQTIGAPGSRQLIVDFDIRRIANFSNFIRFEVILFEGSNDILFQYADVDLGDGNSNGASATVGIRDADGASAGNVLQWSFNQGVLSEGQDILFTFNGSAPEPGTLALLGLGLAGLAATRRRNQ